jgi:hypothetical protein
MTEESLQNQADRAEALAAQTADDEVKRNLRNAALEYRKQLKTEIYDPLPDWRLPREIS